VVERQTQVVERVLDEFSQFLSYLFTVAGLEMIQDVTIVTVNL